ncbi:jg25767 [Pararge aegeria aegeria]|uniref:Jg25767 protein n=1 Tax=Pararge aegeria aegeria TaxID=348720 RepID=A0A8S4QEC7_9NEOP|nr:jg25767 [Pararge aegeria aegeria]
MRILAHFTGLETRAISSLTTSLSLRARSSAFSALEAPGSSRMRPPVAAFLKRRLVMPRSERTIFCPASANTPAYEAPLLSASGYRVRTTAEERGGRSLGTDFAVPGLPPCFVFCGCEPPLSLFLTLFWLTFCHCASLGAEGSAGHLAAAG